MLYYLNSTTNIITYYFSVSQVTNPLIKSNSSTQHNTAIPSNYGNSQPNPVYITNQMAFDQVIHDITIYINFCTTKFKFIVIINKFIIFIVIIKLY